jgi:hypothetical protein
MKFLNFSILWRIFALLDPDQYPTDQNQSGSATVHVFKCRIFYLEGLKLLLELIETLVMLVARGAEQCALHRP